jgi:hypothetical protein
MINDLTEQIADPADFVVVESNAAGRVLAVHLAVMHIVDAAKAFENGPGLVVEVLVTPICKKNISKVWPNPILRPLAL